MMNSIFNESILVDATYLTIASSLFKMEAGRKGSRDHVPEPPYLIVPTVHQTVLRGVTSKLGQRFLTESQSRAIFFGAVLHSDRNPQR